MQLLTLISAQSPKLDHWILFLLPSFFSLYLLSYPSPSPAGFGLWMFSSWLPFFPSPQHGFIATHPILHLFSNGSPKVTQEWMAQLNSTTVSHRSCSLEVQQDSSLNILEPPHVAIVVVPSTSLSAINLLYIFFFQMPLFLYFFASRYFPKSWKTTLLINCH